MGALSDVRLVLIARNHVADPEMRVRNSRSHKDKARDHTRSSFPVCRFCTISMVTMRHKFHPCACLIGKTLSSSGIEESNSLHSYSSIPILDDSPTLYFDVRRYKHGRLVPGLHRASS